MKYRKPHPEFPRESRELNNLRNGPENWARQFGVAHHHSIRRPTPHSTESGVIADTPKINCDRPEQDNKKNNMDRTNDPRAPRIHNLVDQIGRQNKQKRKQPDTRHCAHEASVIVGDATTTFFTAHLSNASEVPYGPSRKQKQDKRPWRHHRWVFSPKICMNSLSTENEILSYGDSPTFTPSKPLASDALLRDLGILLAAAGLHFKPRGTSANPRHSTRCPERSRGEHDRQFRVRRAAPLNSRAQRAQ